MNWIAWPFTMLFRMLEFIFIIFGKVTAILLGFLFLAVGTFMSRLGTIPLIIGILFLLFGFMLIVKGLFFF